MKKILFVASILLGVFLIYLSTLDKKVYYLSVGDELSVGYNIYNQKDYGYTDYIKDYLDKKHILEVYANAYFNEDLRAIDLIRKIEDNEKIKVNGKVRTIKNALIKADLVTLSIGSNDILNKMTLYENFTKEEMYNYIDEFLKDLDNLFKLVRKYCKEDIMFIGYYNVINNKNVDKYYKYLNEKAKELTIKYKIEYVDIYDFVFVEDNALYPNKNEYIKIGEKIVGLIEKKILD